MAKPKRYELTPEQWHRVCDLLPGKTGDLGRSGTDNLKTFALVEAAYASAASGQPVDIGGLLR